ncbi:MAG TPA: hypothetical protein VGG16_11015 [Streptosporangiaceae bacterium]
MGRGRHQLVGRADAGLGADVREQVEDLRLHRDVERGDRLVEHQDGGLDRQRAGDRDDLTLLVASFAIFGCVYLAPGNPVTFLLAGRAASPANISAAEPGAGAACREPCRRCGR